MSPPRLDVAVGSITCVSYGRDVHPWHGSRLTALGAALTLAASLPCQRELDAAACARCHPGVHGEWKDSAHATAYTDPVFARALASRSRPEHCLPCHVPDSVLDRLGQMPRVRRERLQDGVDCTSCHRRGDRIHGPTGAATPAHPTEADPTFLRRGSVGLCTSCHDTAIADVLPLGREFLAAGLLDDGESCIGCHMEKVQRSVANATDGSPLPPRPGRSHRLHGPRDVEFCASAFLLRLAGDRDGATLVVGNGAGHGVPGLRLRSFTFRLTWLAADGKELLREEHVLSWQDRLLAEEERRFPLRKVERAVALRVQVDHNFAGQTLATVLDRNLELP